MSEQLSQLAVRESELRVILERNTEYEAPAGSTRQGDSQESHSGLDRRGDCRSAVFSSSLFRTQLSIVCCPGTFTTALLRGLPPVELFPTKADGKQQLAVPFSLAPTYSQRVWTYLVDEVIPTLIAPPSSRSFARGSTNGFCATGRSVDPRSVELRGSGGRIMLRRRGYRIRPHRDPKWSFITCILYLARPGDDETWGTQLYAVDGDEEAKDAAPFWINDNRCRLVEDVRFPAQSVARVSEFWGRSRRPHP